MIIQINDNEYFCSHCQKTWIGIKNTCNCYDYKKLKITIEFESIKEIKQFEFLSLIDEAIDKYNSKAGFYNVISARVIKNKRS